MSESRAAWRIIQLLMLPEYILGFPERSALVATLGSYLAKAVCTGEARVERPRKSLPLIAMYMCSVLPVNSCTEDRFGDVVKEVVDRHGENQCAALTSLVEHARDFPPLRRLNWHTLVVALFAIAVTSVKDLEMAIASAIAGMEDVTGVIRELAGSLEEK